MHNFLKVLLVGTVLVSISAVTHSATKKQEKQAIAQGAGAVAGAFANQIASGTNSSSKSSSSGSGTSFKMSAGGGTSIDIKLDGNAQPSVSSTTSGGFLSDVGDSISNTWNSTVGTVKDGVNQVVTKTANGLSSVKEGIQDVVGTHSALNSPSIPSPTVVSKVSVVGTSGASGATNITPLTKNFGGYDQVLKNAEEAGAIVYSDGAGGAALSIWR